MEREFTRARETEAKELNVYEKGFAADAEFRKRTLEGRVLLRGKDVPWEQSRQGRLKFYLHESVDDTAVTGWYFFVHDIRTQSGRHRHQGGLAIYVVEGKGWTTVDGVRHDWEEGDLILLPIKVNGVEHQHFNAEPGKPCKWLGIIYMPFRDVFGRELEQREVSPDWTPHV